MRRIIIFLFLAVFFLSWGSPVYAQLKTPGLMKRDPFVPLADDKGMIRNIFVQPERELKIPQVSLQGISRIKGVYYAIIDGEWRKEGDSVKGMTLVKIEMNKVVFGFQERKIEIQLNPDKKP
jgi:hypothetical protein